MNPLRTANVSTFNINTVELGSNLQIGDSCEIDAISHAIAVQKEEEIFFEKEHQFFQYSIFTKPVFLPPIYEPLNIKINNATNFINVQHIDIIGASAASVIHIGNAQHIYLDSRIKHIRHLKNGTKNIINETNVDA